VATDVVTGHRAGDVTVTATATGLTPASKTFTVVPGAASGLTTTLQADKTSLPDDGHSTATVTVAASDAAGNNLTLGGDTVQLDATAGTLSPVTDQHDGTYTATLTAPG